MNYLKSYKLTIIGFLLGAIGGYAYYYFVGCTTGICAITSKPLNSTLYGALVGGLLLSVFNKEDQKKIKTKRKNNL